jgi:hypothetical protein
MARTPTEYRDATGAGVQADHGRPAAGAQACSLQIAGRIRTPSRKVAMIHLIQCLCGPKRHAIFALAYDDQDRNGAEALADFKGMVTLMLKTNAVKPWCGMCALGEDEIAHCESWFYEDRATVFQSMAEAEPYLKQSEADQLATRAFMERSKN